MSVSVEIPGPLLEKIERLKIKPDERPIEVITRLVDYYHEDDELTDEEEDMIFEGLKAIIEKKTIPHDRVMKELGIR